MGTKVFYTEMESPLGPLTIVATEAGVCHIEFGTAEDTLPVLKNWMKKHLLTSDLAVNDEVFQPVIRELLEYFNENRQTFNIKIDLFGTPFQRQVWNELLNIQYGSTKSYKEISEAISAPKAIRAVGGAIGRNPLPIIIPCHRVIGSNGALVGFTGGLDKKEKLLTIEKILENRS